MKDENGNVTGALAAAHDITEHQQAKAALQSSHSLLDAALESTADGILVVSRDRVITRYNQKFAEMWRIPQGILTNWDDAAEIKYILSQLVDTESFLTKVEYLFAHPEESSLDLIEFKDGRIFERYSQPQKIGPDIVGRVWSFRDITERKISDAKILETNKKLTELNAQKDKFFSIIAHDLRSPFNSIMGFSQLLVDQIIEKDYEGIEQYARIMRQSAEHAINLLTNLLEWSRAQTGRIEFKPDYLELVNFIEKIIPVFENVALQKSITIKRSLPHESLVYADKHMISTVLRNLISNAIKFTRQGGEVIVSAQRVKNEAIVSVKDNGVGISKDQIDKLFRIDQSESTPGTNNEQGTGLGLILCKEFVEKHGGRIGVESQEGKGSLFTFTIPVK